MFQLNAPNKSGHYPGNTIQYKIVPWYGGLWFAPLNSNLLLPSTNAFSQIYNVFTGDSDTPTKKGQYKVINNLDAYTFYKRNPSSPYDVLNNPDMVLLPRGTGELWAGAATVGIVSNIAGWDNVTPRHGNEWYRSARGQAAGIYLYDSDGEVATPDHISSDTLGQRVYDTADFLVGGSRQFLPTDPTTIMPNAGSILANGFNNQYCMLLGADGVAAPVTLTLLPLPMAGKTQLTFDVNIIHVSPVNNNVNDVFVVEMFRIDSDGNTQTQLIVQYTGTPLQVDALSISAGSGLNSIVNGSILSGSTQFALGDAMFFTLNAISGGGSTVWFLTLKATIT